LEQEVGQIISIVPVVAAGFGVSIVPRSFSEVHFGGIRYLDIDGEAPRSALALVYRRDERSAAVKNLLKAARSAKLRG
jgi:DNA-binding transcriptional LysR family regulator